MALQKNRKFRRIAVVGAGTAGYLTTLFLVKNLPDTSIDWIYPKDSKTIGVGEATTPQVQNFLDKLGIPVETILKDINGGLKLGIRFKGFGSKDFNHPFGDDDKNAAALDYIMTNNKISFNILNFTDIASHFDVSELTNYLDNILPQHKNLQIIRDTVTDINELEADLIIDCTGFNSKFNGKFKSIKYRIPNDKALTYRCSYSDRNSQQLPYTTCTAMDNGWCWSIPLKNKISYGYVYDSVQEGDTISEFTKFLDDNNAAMDGVFNEIDMKTGRLENHIQEADKTVISIGLSASFIEPLESTGLYLTTFGIENMFKYINNEISATEYNNIVNHEYDVITDFIETHYKSSRNTNEYWSSYRSQVCNTHTENNIFPLRSWDYIIGGLEDSETIELPKLSAREIISLRKGKPYTQWRINESYT